MSQLSKEYGKFTVAYLDFNEESSSNDLGTEVDLTWDYKIAKNLDLSASGSFYDKDEVATNDVTRYTLQLDYKF